VIGDTRKRRARANRESGQSLTELALVLPILLVITLVAIDFGRVYLGWVNLQNMARIAANYASNNPTAWYGTGDAAVQASYQQEILNDARANNCTLPMAGGNQVAPDPTFPAGTGVGGTAEVRLDCTFHLITPIIGSIVGSGGNLTVSAAAVFPVKSVILSPGGQQTGPTAAFSASPPGGQLDAVTMQLAVNFTDLSTGGVTSRSWTFGDGGTSTATNPSHTYTAAGTYTVTLTVLNGGGASDSTSQQITVINPPPSSCTVPDFVSKPGVDNTAAQQVWANAGFTTTVVLQDDGNGGNGTWKIKKQSLLAGSNQPCNVAITLYQKA
jgi:PKD repeat protein